MNETDNAYYLDKTPPLIKMSAFTILSEQEISKMRSFISITDPRIQAGEVFFYCPNSLNRDIEGDDRQYDSNKLVSTGANAGANAGANRRKVETLLADGSSSTAFTQGRKVMWHNPTVSPAQFVLVNINLP